MDIGKKIDFMIIGSQKAGTSSLSFYLSQHPNLLLHETSEFVYFFQDDFYNKGFENALKVNYNLNKISSDTILLAKNVMVMYDKISLERLYAHNASVKLIIMLRNPVSRAYSSFWFAKSTGRENSQSFEEALESPKDESRYIKQNLQYLEMGEYAKYLTIIFEIFPKENIKIIIFEEFINNLSNELNDLLNFFKLPAYKFDVSKRINESSKARFETVAKIAAPGKKGLAAKLLPVKIRKSIRRFLINHNSKTFKAPPISLKTKKKLEDYYASHNSMLEKIINRNLKIWK